MWGLSLLFLGLLLFGAPLLALFWAAQARRKADEAADRAAEAELEIRRLRRQVERLAPGAPPVARPEPEPAELESAATVPSPAGEPEPAQAAPTAAPAAGPATGAAEPPPLPPREPPAPRVDWEQWIGVRGAAVLGGVVLALAAILFLKFSIERGLIPPIVRVAAAVLAGIGALLGAEWLRRRAYDAVANALSGAGIVALYAAIWAARALYELIPVGLAFALMVLVTVVCGLLSWRYRSLVIALLGLTGGFATPLLLSTGQDRPIGLFGYILLLDVGLLVLARQRGWPLLAALSLGGTALYQALWIFARMDPDRALLGLGILAVFGMLYAVASRYGEPEKEGESWRLTSFAGVLLPFLFAVYFAARANLGEHLLPLALLLALLAGAALWMARLHGVPALATASATAVVVVVLVWLARSALTDALAWEAAGIAIGLALIFHLFGRRAEAVEAGPAAELTDPGLLVPGGLLLGLLFAHAGVRPAALWPWLLGWTALAALLYHGGSDRRRSYRRPLAAAAVGVGFVGFWLAHGREPTFPAAELFFGLAVVLGVVLQGLAMRVRRAPSRLAADFAAAALPAVVMVGLLGDIDHPLLTPGVFLATSVVLAFLVVLAATRSGLGALYLGAAGLLALAHSLWVESLLRAGPNDSTLLATMAALYGVVLLFTFWPAIAGGELAGDRWALYGAALAAPAWFFALRALWLARFGDAAIGALPIALGLASLGAAARARGRWSAERPERKRALVWFLAVALSFVTLAIPLQLEREWVTIGWALQGLAMMALWRRLDHPGLKYFGLALLAVVTVRLVANAEVLRYHEKAAVPVLNWLMYTYLVPAAALLGSARLLSGLELPRLRRWEDPLYPKRWALAGGACGLAAVLVAFVWINLAIFDYFAAAGPLTFSFERQPARDLTLSIAWALYAVVLLAAGMVRKSVALRWVSLAFLILTIGKVFLYDLGELEDLYRVASLVGLALSLIAVSLAYQRFVFPGGRGGAET